MADAVAEENWEELCAGLPREALAIVSELLGASEDPDARAAGRRIEARLGFVLSAESPDGGRRLFLSIPAFHPEFRRREPFNPANCRQISPDDVRAWFLPGGRFASATPGWESRPEQIEMAVAVADAFNGSHHAVVEAGTGVGKTFAYLVPAAMWSVANDTPVVISTNTKNLQEQLFRKDLPLVAQLLRSPVRFALVKGRGNYLCLSRLENLVEHREAELVRGELPTLARAVAWAFSTQDGDLTSFRPGPPPPDAVPGLRFSDRISSLGDDCRGRKCPYFQRCFVQRARDAALAADVVVTNHAVFFAEPDDKPLALPKAAHVIFDEAHNLEEAATAHFEREIGPRALRRQLRRLLTPPRRKGASGKSGAAAALGVGLLPDLEQALLSGPLMATPEARDAMFALVSRARSACEATGRSGAAWFRALALLLGADGNPLRLRPQTLEARRWQEAAPLLSTFQDDLEALFSALSLFSKVFSPRVDSDGAAIPPPRTPPPLERGGAAQGGGRGGAATIPPGIPLALSPAATAPAPAPFSARGNAPTEAPARPLGAIVADLARRLEMAVASLSEMIADVEFLSSASDEDWVYWIEPVFAPGGRRMPEAGLRAAPVEISRFLAEGLFAKRDSVILCSATMSAGGSTKFLSHRLGLDFVRDSNPEHIVETRLGSPFDYPRQCLAAVPMHLPESMGPGGGGDSPDAPFPAAFGDMTARLAIAARGGTLVLFTSYRTMRAVATRMQPALRDAGIELLVQGEGASREEITARFRDGESPSVLLGTNSFWEGVDLVGDALRCLVIAKLPFDSPGDPLVDARGERVARDGGNSFRDYSLPAAAIRLRQGFGRLIRNKNDRGVVVIADPRIWTKNYGGIFRRDLPVEAQRFSDTDSLCAAAAPFFAPASAQ